MNTILLADSQPLSRELLDVALQQAGFRTLVATNGAKALEIVQQHAVDMIVLEIDLPVMNGLTLLKGIRAGSKDAGIPVFVLTTVAEKRIVLETAKLGVSGFMLKSHFSLSELLKSIRKACARPVEAAETDVAASTNAPRLSLGQASLSPSAPEHISSANDPALTGQAEALTRLRPIMTRSELTRRLEGCGELKGFSPVVSEVLKLAGNARCSIDDVARSVSRDPAIALKILKLANSVVYTRGEPVDSVHKAVLRIGLGPIRQALLNLAVVERFNSGIEGFIDSGQFWEHAIATGIIAAEIAHTRGEKHADSAFTMGLLHDVGRMVYVSQLGESYRAVLQAAHDLQLPLEQVEHRMLSASHADVMDSVFRTWKFSKEFINPIAFHHASAGQIRDAAPHEAIEVATLGLANRLAHALMLGSSGNQTIYPTEEHCDLLRLDETVISRIEQIARDETDKVKFSLLANSNQSNWCSGREIHRQALAAPLRPLYVSGAPALDAHRIFCDQLAAAQENVKPNLGIISLRGARDRSTLSEQFRAKEARCGVQNLPLLVISPGGKIVPDNSLLLSRQFESLATPFAINRFIAIANRLLGSQSARAAA